MLYSLLGYIASLIYSILLYTTYLMLYSKCIYHAIQQVRLYIFPHIWHFAMQHIFYAIQHMNIPCYIACQAIQLPSYIASCYIAHILCYIAHEYSRCYIAPGYIAHRSAIQRCLQQRQSYIAPVQAIQHDPRFQMQGPRRSPATAS